MKVLLGVLFLAVAVSAVRADPVTITSGSVSATLVGGSFSFTGDNFTLSGNLSHTFFGGNNFAPNTTAQIRVFASGLDILPGPGVIDGINYSLLHYEGVIDVAATGFLPPIDSSDFFTITAPFTLTGFLAVCNGENISGCQTPLVFDHVITGGGIATFEFVVVHDGTFSRYDLLQATYTVSSVPEPASLLLMGTALSGLAEMIRRRRHRIRRQEK